LSQFFLSATNDGGVTGSGEEIIRPGGILDGEKGEQREGSAGFIGEGSQRPLGLMERGKWGGDRGHGRSGSEVGDDPDRWVPPVSSERKREKGEREKLQACWAVGFGLAQLGCCLFCNLFFFYFLLCDFFRV
jgi:hypothetical protein